MVIGGADMSENRRKMLLFYSLDFREMTTPVLVISGRLMFACI